MEPFLKHAQALTRRHFLGSCNFGIGSIALGMLLGNKSAARGAEPAVNPLAPKKPPLAAKAKNIIYLHMSGGPPQQELFDWKPELVKHNLQPCPEELLKNQRFAFIKGRPHLLGTPYKFAQHGNSGAWVSELLPHISGIVDDVAFVKSMVTDQMNHAPAEMYLLTGSPRSGSASLGSWITYGLGSESQDLPGFVVLVSGDSLPSGGNTLWTSGFLPAMFQGVQCRSRGEPVLFVANPKGIDRGVRRRSLDALRELNEMEATQFGSPETVARIAQYELAYRMQASVPEVMDISREPQHVLDMYGAKPGGASFANNCVLARRLVEQGVRCVQLFDWHWDTHGSALRDDIMTHLPWQCKSVDQPIAALVRDLKARGLLDETLIVWGGEFGRTPMNEGRNGSKLLGRDHHPGCFTMWLAGGGIKPGIIYGETDDLSYSVTKDKVTVHDLQATVLHLLGLDPFKLDYRYQGLNQRLIGPTNEAKIQHALIA